MIGACQRDPEANWKSSRGPKLEGFKKINNEVPNYTPNMQEPMLVYIEGRKQSFVQKHPEYLHSSLWESVELHMPPLSFLASALQCSWTQ